MPAGLPFGHFLLHRRLARGGMAEVFLARQRGPEGFDRMVAVKRILPHLAAQADFVRMFLDEARLAARLSHPSIVHIYEFGKVDDDYFIAMEFVDGVHAGQLARLAERLPPALVARLGADAASALAYAHRLEDADGRPLALVHRDVSPANLMVSFDGAVKLVDFGIAKATAGAGQTRPGVIKGKFAYMSPEQTVGRSLDGRSDVFSLAIVLWELLAGRHLVERADPVAAMRALRDGAFPRLDEVAPHVPAALAAALDHALAVDRDDRATAAELGLALEAYIKSSPDLATSMQLSDWVRARFPRMPTRPQPALPDGAASGRRDAGSSTGAGPVTRATSVSGAADALPAGAARRGPDARAAPGTGPERGGPPTRATAVTGAATVTTSDATAVALPPREATILRRALDELVSLDAVPDAGETPLEPGEFAAPGSRQVAPGGAAAARPRRRLALAGAALAAALLAGWALRPGAGPPQAPAAPGASTSTPLAAPGAPEAPRPATLDVLTTPAGATATLEGRDAAPMRTPASFHGLPPGPVVLRVELAGHEPVRRELTLAAGDRRTFELALAPARPPATTPAAPPPGRDPARDRDAARDRDRPRPSRPSAAAAAPGTLAVRTTPYSVVYDGVRRLGETPFVVQLPAGTYALRFEHPTAGTRTRTVTIRAGETTKLKFEL